MKRYALAVEVRDAEEDSHVTDLLDAAGMKWWHYVRGFWLVVAEDDRVPQKITGILSGSPRLADRPHFILNADEPTAWWGAVSAPAAADSARFLQEDWDARVPDRSHHAALSP